MALNESLKKVMEMTGGSMAVVGAGVGAKPVIDSFGKVGSRTVRRGMPMMTPESGAAINAESMPMMPRPPIPNEYNDL